MAKDARDNILEIGQRVVYNLSGELSVGIITNIIEKYRVYYSHTYFSGTIYIKQDNKEHISKIKNPKGIIVVDCL